MTTQLAPDLDTAMVLGMASTALPFARSPEAEAERWLRILRLHGSAGVALQALGVSEAPLEAATGEQGGRIIGSAGRRDMVAAVSDHAGVVAASRGAPAIGAEDVLVAVMQLYGEDFDHVLHVHGTERQEVLQRLGIEMPEDAAG